MTRLLCLCSAAAALLLSACPQVTSARTCENDDECRPGLTCEQGACVDNGSPPPLPDGGTPNPGKDGGTPDGEDGGTPTPGEDSGPPIVLGPPALHAISDGVQAEGETLRLEGSFSGETIVHFPGGPNVIATVEGAGRATVVIPTGAGSGALEITTGGARVGAVPFRAVVSPLALGPPSAALLQNEFGLQTHPLGAATGGAVAFGGERSFCVAGGDDGALLPEVRCQPVARAEDALGLATTRAPLEAARADASIVRVGDSVLVIGGRDAAGESGAIERIVLPLDGDPGAHTVFTTALGQARSGATAHVIGPYLYVIGGEAGGVRLTSVERALLDPTGEPGRFEAVATLSESRAHHASAVLGNRLYVLGGAGESVDSVESATIESAAIDADGDLGLFSTDTAALPNPLARAGALRVGEVLYLFGGVSILNLSDDVLRFDGATAEVTGMTLIRPRRDAAVTVAGNHVLIAGGLVDGVDEDAPTDLIERSYLFGGEPSFSPVNGASFGEERFFTAFAAAGDTAYVLGGGEQIFNGQGDLTDENSLRETFSAALDDQGISSFTATGQDMVSRRTAPAAAVANGFLYVFGGFQYAGQVGGALTTLDTIERAGINPDGTLGSFEVVQGVQLDEPRDSMCAVIFGDFVYLLGGYDELAPTVNIERGELLPNGDVANFQRVASTLTLARDGGQACAVVGNHLYVAGGTIFQDVVNNVSVFQASNRVERALIAPDGTLGGFAQVQDLVEEREGAVITTAGDRVYVMGGMHYDGDDETQTFVFSSSIESSLVTGAPAFGLETGTLNTGRTSGFLVRSRPGPLVGGGGNGEFLTTIELGVFQ